MSNTQNETYLELAAKLEKGITIDKKTGVGEAKDDLYESNLPETLTMEQVKQVSDYNASFVAAGTHAFGKMAVEAMKSNKHLSEASCDFKMGVKDNLGVTVQRSKTFINHLGDGNEITKYGVVSATYDVRAGKNAGQLKAARTAIGELASEALK